MKKLFSVLLLILFASASILSGCDLITLNELKYYNTVVMTVGDTQFTKEELITRFNQIGAQYVQDGYSVEQAMQFTIDSMINRQLIISFAKDTMGELSQADKNAVWQEVYDSVNNQLKEIEGQIKVEWNLVVVVGEEAPAPKTFDTYKPYEPKVTLVNGQFVLVQTPLAPEEDPIGAFVREDFNPGIDEVASGRTYAEVQQESWNRYVRNLKNAESWQKLSTVTEEVFARELNRLYKIFEGNKYVNNLEKHFNDNLPIDNNLVVEKYIELVQDSFAKYSIDMQAYHSAMGSDSKAAYYHPNSGSEYIYVSHVLIQYNDEQKALIESYKTQLQQGQIDQVTYDANMLLLQNQIAGKARDAEGLEYGDAINASQILSEIQAALATLGNDVDAKAAKFNEFIYKYNQDPGMFNAEVPYVINLDTTVQDKMVKPFADTSRQLYTQGEGSLSELVLTDFGYHIIFYSRPVQNIIHYNNLLNITPEALYDVLISPGLEQTMYHKIFEAVTRRSYANYQTSLLNQLKSQVEVVLYESRYADLLK